ncbi:MAG: glycerophosphodiester phosphodiesterase family protein [Candidatus Sumerlaeales bacterium]|nr:glycerophosphodiester phosphodiesterase family protein [Candidatus Sumerlaeales bacterium]
MKRIVATMICTVSILAGSTGVFAGTPDIIAHRGASYEDAGYTYSPENTIASNKLAWEMNSDGVECDVHLSADKRVMVMHDGNTSRTTAGKISVDIAKTSSSELRKIDVGSWYNKKYASETLPFLEELIELVPPGKKLYVEIKCGSEVLPFVDEIFTKSGKRNQMVIIGFGLDTMTDAVKMMPDVPVYYLRGGEKDPKTGKVLPHSVDFVKVCKERKITGLDMWCTGCDKNFCDAVLGANLGLIAWTVDDPKEMLRCAKVGVQGVTTNCPDVMLKALAKAKKTDN